ncbi:hypothetical protein J8J42_08560 [Chryseobacterium sp. cx-311]|uniref:hypothetical protein n=1 Tax=Marnyiella aurantia TaxID=2758037 RepID=UPI001115EC93|nr:hypothetical protein [Marnyiella aurantia]MBP0613097.1 hypothetical protein [Marnyiella aurantia]
MNTNRNKNYIVNYIFIFGILILFLNDQIFKFEFSNYFTGKLSDVCGIIIFPFFLTYIFPKLKQNSVFAAAIIFSFWKSQYSQSLINFYNEISPIQTSRIIDYSDLFVLLLLPIPYYLIKNVHKIDFLTIKKLNPKFIFVISLFIFIAEAPPPSHYFTMNNGNLQCYKCNMKVNHSKDYVLNKLKQNGIEFDTVRLIHYRSVIDSTSGGKKYIKNELIIDNDTLRNISFTIFPLKGNRTQIYFNGADVSQDLRRDDFKLQRKMRKYYRKIVFDEIKRSF